MPDIVVPESDIAVHNVQLSADTEQRVVFERDSSSLEIVVLDADSPIYFTVDDTVAIVGGGNTRLTFPGLNSTVIDVSAWSGQSVVRLISAASATVSLLVG